MTAKPRQQHITWPKTYRMVSAAMFSMSRIDDVAGTNDWGLLESSVIKTKSYSAAQTRNLMAIPEARRIPLKPGADIILAPFMNCSRERPSRFSDGSFGLWYAANREETALHERFHHYRKHILASAATRNTGSSSGFKTLIGSVDCRLHNVNSIPAVLDENDYTASQKLGASLRDADSNGVVWNSVRDPDGKCIGLFWPNVVGRPVKSGTEFTIRRDGGGNFFVKNHRTGKVFEVA